VCDDVPVVPLRYVALLRGINVGTAKRIAMADLRNIFTSLGYGNVRTLLQSGNVVFEGGTSAVPPAGASSDSSGQVDVAAAASVEDAVAAATGIRASTIVLSEQRFRAVLADNPFVDAADPSRMLISFCDVTPHDDLTARPSDAELAPEQIVFGDHGIYQWLPDGVLQTKLPARFLAQSGVVSTARNLRTSNKILAVLDTP
jgi:uncharacterized protein (DUF1697 family)